MRVAALVSGGKDSALALHRTLKEKCKVTYLVTMLPQREDSWMFHYPNIRMTDLFAEAVDIPLVKADTSGVKEAELEDLKRLLARLDIDGVVSGGISSQYQKSRIDRVCQELGLRHIAPLWQEEPLKLLREILSTRITTIIVGVYAHGFNETWLGRKIDKHTINDLKKVNREFKISLVGEGGEYETLVLDARFFKKKIEIVETERIWENESGYMLIKKAVLVGKEVSPKHRTGQQQRAKT